jgi:ABC-2 type transport system permease protein
MSTPANPRGGAGRRTQGVIHDLGYRHYDGPRLGGRMITRALFVESAKGAYGLGRSARSKVMPMLLLALMCLPAVIVAVVAVVTKDDMSSSTYTFYTLRASVLVMIYLAGQAPASVSRDLRFRVMSLYFSRPLRRIDYVVAKYAALTAALIVFMVLPLTILFAGALLAKQTVAAQGPDYVRSLVGAVLLALILAGIGLVIAAFTPRRGLGIAAIIAVLAVASGVQGAVQAIAIDKSQDTFAGYAGLLSPFTLIQGVQRALLGAQTDLPAEPPGLLGALVFLALGVAIVVGCFAALLLRYRKVSI